VMFRRLGFESFSLFSKSPQMPAYQTNPHFRNSYM
jgi:hypothetical protein